MFAIDFHIHEIKARHRVSLFSLLKLAFGDLEPCFSKIVAVRDALASSSFEVKPFGFMALVRADFLEEMMKSAIKLDLKAEVYHDRDELALVCAGHTEVSLSQPLRLRSRLSAGLSSQKFTNIATTGDFSISMFHKAQNKHQISAGCIDMSIDIYEINLKCILNPSSIVPTADPNVDNTHDQSVLVTLPAPPIITISPAESVDSLQNDDEVDINTTKEDIDYLVDDYDPIDDFVNDFLSNRFAAPAVNPVPATPPLVPPQQKSTSSMHNIPVSGLTSRVRFSGGNSTSRPVTTSASQRRTATASQRRPPPPSAATSRSRPTSNYGRGLSMF